MAAVFRLTRDGKRPLTVRLDRDAVVGRGSAAGLRIDSRKVSREHCRLSIDEDVVAVRDLGSRNGTTVDGETVGEDADFDVPVGSVLSVGGVELRLVRCGEVTVDPHATVPERLESERPIPDRTRPELVREREEPAAEPETPLVADATPPGDEPDSFAGSVEPAEDHGEAEHSDDAGATTLAEEPSAADPAALGFLGDDAEDTADENSALKVLPGGDARDQSSFTGFGEPENAVDSGLLDFLGRDDR